MQGKVVFVAPTKPLVNQQIDACYEFMGVSKVLTHSQDDHCCCTHLAGGSSPFLSSCWSNTYHCSPTADNLQCAQSAFIHAMPAWLIPAEVHSPHVMLVNLLELVSLCCTCKQHQVDVDECRPL